jgi:ketosteroid isomerase-like protein
MIVFLAGCAGRNGTDLTERYRAEIIQTETEFARMAEERGLAQAFFEFADSLAIINRGGVLIQGKEAIKSYYESHLQPGASLKWAPDFADVSGELGYTYGSYVHAAPDSTGNITESRGIFHTVWKRQPDGRWRFVWD